jgi:hypothetical protein
MTTDPRIGSEASDLGRFEPSPYDLGITDDPEPQSPSQADLWAAQNAPRIANAAGCTDAEYERLLDVRQQAEAAYLARWGSLAPEPRTEAELAAAARAGAWGPQSPVPYSLTPEAEAALSGSREIEEAFHTAEENYGRQPGTAARLLADQEIAGPEAAYELAAEVLDEWDSAESAAHQDRLEAQGAEPEAEAEP